MDQSGVDVVPAPVARSVGWVIQRTDAPGLYLILGDGGQRWGSWIDAAVHFVRRRDAVAYRDAYCVSVPVEVVRDVR